VTRAKGAPADRWMFHLSGGRLCLDLANTVSWRRGGQPIERLRDYGDVVAWARQARVLAEREARLLQGEAMRHPSAAARVLARARALREAIYRLFAALARGTAPNAADLAHLDQELNDALRHLHLVQARPGFALAWPTVTGQLGHPLWAVARSAAEVLTSDDLRRLKTCPAANCGWVFLDTTRSGTRRWCDMTVCGSRAKARRYYARHRDVGRRRASPARQARGRRGGPT
jgi:predicted RNA-binding Zn ribbon-like protein